MRRVMSCFATARLAHEAHRTNLQFPANRVGSSQNNTTEATPRANCWGKMAEEQAAHHLLNVLEERGLDVDLDKILLAFEDEDKKVAVATWVEEYLHDDTLLTKEEHEL
jgi:hypothetical protein